jgi:hypothetical protein
MADAGVKRKGFPQRSKEAKGILRSGSKRQRAKEILLSFKMEGDDERTT